jgi:hypothetical protein
MPMTMAIVLFDVVVCSQRMPPIFLSSISKSFGHLTETVRPAREVRQSAAAKAAHNGIQDNQGPMRAVPGRGTTTTEV